MKKILVSIAALFAAAAMLSAQNMSEATETAKLANESLSAGNYETALAGFQEALKMAEACGDEGLELVATCKEIIPKTVNAIAKQLLQEDNLDGAIAKFGEAVAIANEYGDEETAAKAAALGFGGNLAGKIAGVRSAHKFNAGKQALSD